MIKKLFKALAPWCRFFITEYSRMHSDRTTRQKSHSFSFPWFHSFAPRTTDLCPPDFVGKNLCNNQEKTPYYFLKFAEFCDQQIISGQSHFGLSKREDSRAVWSIAYANTGWAESQKYRLWDRAVACAALSRKTVHADFIEGSRVLISSGSVTSSFNASWALPIPYSWSLFDLMLFLFIYLNIIES